MENLTKKQLLEKIAEQEDCERELKNENDDLLGKNGDLTDEIAELNLRIKELEDEHMRHIEVFSNDVIRFEEPKNMQDRFIIDALILCFKVGKPNDLLSHLEAFAAEHNTAQLIPGYGL